MDSNETPTERLTMEAILVVLLAGVIAIVADIVVDLIFEDEKPKMIDLLFPGFDDKNKNGHW